MITGRAHKFGDDVNTDAILPARYLNTSDPAELARHVMEDADAGFAKKVRKGEVIVAGKNFGCGSSREHAPVAIKAAGVTCVVAASFARIFFRNAINIGLPAVEAPGLAAVVEDGDEVEIDLESGRALHGGKEYPVAPYPRELQEIVNEGGLIAYTKARRGGP